MYLLNESKLLENIKMYKTKLKVGDYFSADITPEQYSGVCQRLIEEGCEGYGRPWWCIGVYKYFGWSATGLSFSNGVSAGRFLSYEQVMEKVDPDAWSKECLAPPPIGTECEVLVNGKWIKCKIVNFLKNRLGLTDILYSYFDSLNQESWNFTRDIKNFRPTITHKELVISTAISSGLICSTAYDRDLVNKLAELWYDRGLLKLPEDEE